MDLRTITGTEILTELHNKYDRFMKYALASLIVTSVFAAFMLYAWITGGLIFAAVLVAISLIVFLVFRKRASNVEDLALFKRYGSPEEIAAHLRQGSDRVIYQTNTFLMTDSFFMNPSNLETFIPFSDIQLAYLYKQSTNFIPTEQGLALHDIYNNQVRFSFHVGKKGRTEIEMIMVRLKMAAPWIALGYSTQNTRAAAANKIKIGDPKPVRQYSDNRQNLM